ncbi:hypothetical protein LGN30_27320 [Burkholderia seminalis]|uniref:hypothetical protein n=1 Tax=Burkholderia seminalis TaxID=488731 RepID=UPI001CF0E776|nr:hypothetical protein [Burkholderia seminalis]MCA8426891.1 hypothetical protein [Burkholderia seminalis]
MSDDGASVPPIARAEAVLEYLVAEGGVSISLSQVCKLAKVSRASIYENHPDFVSRVKSLRQPKKSRSPKLDPVLQNILEENELLKLQNRALLYLCVELKSKLASLGSGNQR